MKKRLYFLTFFALLLFTFLAKAQHIDFTLQYNDTSDEYEVYGTSDFNQNLFFVGGGSQISVVLPASLADTPLKIITVAGGFWADNSQVLIPIADPTHDFHGIASNGSIMSWTSGVKTLLFKFTIPGGGCLSGIRLWENGFDPPYNTPGMAGGDFNNYFADAFTFVNFYRQNYNNTGINCGSIPLPPIANPDAVTTDENTRINVDVQTNDTDPQNQVITTLVIAPPNNGTSIVLNGDSIQYIPNMGFIGMDTLQYAICNTSNLCDTTTLIITINNVNDKPVAVDDVDSTPFDTPIIIDIQKNDNDPDGDPLITSIISHPTKGIINNINGDSIAYTPNPNFSGMDTLTYQVCDPLGLCDTAIVVITVGPRFDLALVKTRSVNQRPGAAKNGQVQFTIKIINQGSVDAYDINIIDYYQAAFVFNTGLNTAAQTGNANNWNNDGTYTMDYLAAGQIDSIEINLIIPGNTIDTIAFNAAEIAFATAVDGSNINTQDIDSKPDAIADNDTFGKDNEINNNFFDEDDHDIAYVGIYQSVDPIGYLYCDKTGAIITGGTISVSGPGVIYIIEDGLDGMYSWVTDGTPGEYIMTYNHPNTLPISIVCPPQSGAYDPTGRDGSPEDMDGDANNNMIVLGTENVSNGYLVDTSCTTNPYYVKFFLASGDPIISGNNIPLRCNFIGATVCEDQNNNGMPDPGETGIPNALVYLYNCADTLSPIDSTFTNNLGEYKFEALGQGDYMVQFVTGDDFRFALEHSPLGKIEARNGYTQCITLNYSDCDTTQRLCMVPCVPISLNVAEDNVNLNADEDISITVSGGGKIKWSPNIGIDCDTCSTVIITATDDIVYTINTDDGYGCSDQATLKVNVNKTALRIEDPCNCLGNESAPNANDGQFSERIVVTSASGETWYISNVVGLYQNPTAPTFPPLANVGQYALIPFNTGSQGNKLVERVLGGGQSEYVLEGIHVDGIGYNITLDNGQKTLSTRNSCNYTASCRFNIITTPDGTPGSPEIDECAQNFVMGIGNTPMLDSIKCCEENKNTFMDDGLVDGLYQDTAARNSIMTICPQNQWQYLKYNFNQFDLAVGDTLYVFDGRDTLANLIGKYSGAGVSQTGGWLAANCAPSVNAGGCITFQFKTNGDNTKGIGWNGNFECQQRDVQLSPPNNLNAKLECSETYAIFDIKPATITSTCSTLQDSQIVRVFNAHGAICLDTCLASTDVVRDTFGVGSYLIEYKLKSDTVKSTKAILSVQGASLVCNDEINIPLGSACAVMLTPDDLLESTCDTITDTIYYYITLKGLDKNGKEEVLATGGGKGGNYPMVSKEMLDACGGHISATIEKRYYEGLNLSFCNNGIYREECTVKVNVKDQSAPWFTNIAATDTFKLCAIDLTETGFATLKPEAVDNCGAASVSFVNATIINQGGTTCDTSRVNVTWQASDECGNTTSITQLVVFLRPTITDIIKATDVVLSCGEDEVNAINDFAKTGTPGIKVGRIKNGVLIPTDTLALNETDYVCGYILQHRDVQVPADCGIKVFRYWDILDWCDTNTGIIPVDTQFIELRDTLAPTFVENELATAKLDLPHDACSLDITKLEQPTATDNCGVPTVSLDKVFRIENGTRWEIPASELTALDCDSFEVRWVAVDDCHAQVINDTLTQIVLIDDNTKPSAACTDKINISLGRNEAKIHYSEIDGGSYDACGIVKYEVSRDEINWDTVVIVSCEDIHTEVNVFLRVTDGKGNQNTCWMTVNVEDKIQPICADLSDMTESCAEGHGNGLVSTDTDGDKEMEENEWVGMTEEQAVYFNAKYGNPNCSDNVTCQELVIQQQYQFIEKACGIAHIKRRYRAIDWEGQGRKSNWSEQNINIEYKADWTITLPADWKGSCGQTVPTSEVLITNGTCDLMAYEVEEKVFTTIEEACLKVVRTFTIINWCTYEAGVEPIRITRVENEQGIVTQSQTITSQGFEKVGRLEYIQILKLNDNTAPIITLEVVDTCLASTDCGASKRFAITATDCNELSTAGLVYNWVISTNDTELAKGEGSFFDYPVAPKVRYNVRWVVSDNCGNTAWKEVPYEFWDCKKPAPYCLHGIAVDLMEEVGTIQIWAKDLDINSADNCTPTDKLQFRIWHEALGDAPTDLAGVQALPEVITLNCAYLGNQSVNLYVIDEEGNWDYCNTYVNVQDNTGACGNTEPATMALVSGTIMDWKADNTVEGVMVTTRTSTTNSEMETETDGFYNFELAMYNDYTITPAKDIQPLNGVSTFDLVLITKHILGQQVFTNPYQLIAADVNNSGTITAFDMVQTRKLILAIDTEFANNTSWRFVEATYEFITDSPLTENFPEMTRITDLSHDMQMDFVAIKIGDVNGNARSNSLIQAESRTTTKTFEITTEDRDLKAGERYSFTFSTNQLNEIQGYQFTLGYENLRVEKLKSGVVGVENFGLHKMEDGLITTSWTQQNVLPVTGNSQLATNLFTLEFIALQDGRLSEQLSMLNRPTMIEAYDENGDMMDVQLTFTVPLFGDEFKLFQNQPNPFHDKTMIGFNLPDASEVQLILRDETGRILKSLKEDRKAGYNTIQLKKEELTNGIIYYQLTTKFGTKTKKMLKLK